MFLSPRLSLTHSLISQDERESVCKTVCRRDEGLPRFPPWRRVLHFHFIYLKSFMASDSCALNESHPITNVYIFCVFQQSIRGSEKHGELWKVEEKLLKFLFIFALRQSVVFACMRVYHRPCVKRVRVYLVSTQEVASHSKCQSISSTYIYVHQTASFAHSNCFWFVSV